MLQTITNHKTKQKWGKPKVDDKDNERKVCASKELGNREINQDV